ncbi:sensor histidine kinase [Sporosalibacterium faouarense]|uniref:sensor histidine kinase n=1 Tax=Sporosalibacterium faouarense TaxID=516123 RepID=UPI00141CB536|nr:ATP-binding protein [Sporosalibacterium faouarense]MTI48772.1 GHKL domain-containing protein [Bacillota bacterium]
MKLDSKAYILVIAILAQNVVVLLLANKTFVSFLDQTIDAYRYPLFVAIFINILGFIGVISVHYIIKFLKKEKDFILKLNDSKGIIDALQGQKHDFNNHLNVVAGLLQIGKDKQALEYIFKISGKVEEVFSISKIKNVEIAATLYRKCAIAESKGIEVDLYIDSNLEYIKIAPIDICKILFNLIDNAIYELDNCRDEVRVLTLDINEVDDKYRISIGNSYPVLSPDLYKKVFDRGFSTKGAGSGHGYGLGIVKSIVEKNKGIIYVESFENVGTVFTIELPMNVRLREAEAQ